MDQGPKPTGGYREIDIKDCLAPWCDDGLPAMLQSPGSPFFYLPVFTKLEELRAFMTRVDTPYDSVKQVTDGHAFMLSFPEKVKIMHDPYFTDEGKIRWSELRPN